MRKLLLAFIALAIAFPVFAKDRRTPVSIYVYVKDSGPFVDGFTKARNDSKKDLLKYLKKKKKTFRIVDDPADAIIRLEVVDRKILDDPTRERTDLFGETYKEKKVVLYTIMRVGDYEEEFGGVSKDIFDKKGAAKVLVSFLEDWVKDNYETLQAMYGDLK